jgi:hypothetical protein
MRERFGSMVSMPFPPAGSGKLSPSGEGILFGSLPWHRIEKFWTKTLKISKTTTKDSDSMVHTLFHTNSHL